MIFAIVVLLGTGAFIASPAVMIWGWVRWVRCKEKLNLFVVLSLSGLTLATASELLGISTMIYARVSGGFAYYAPTLMRIYVWGMLLSFAGLILATVGIWRPNSVRWHAIGCTVGTLLYWLAAASAE